MKVNDGASKTLWYTYGVAHVPVSFPEGKADCRHCRFVRFMEPYRLYRCALLTTENLIEPSKLDELHPLCPIEWAETPF